MKDRAMKEKVWERILEKRVQRESMNSRAMKEKVCGEGEEARKEEEHQGERNCEESPEKTPHEGEATKGGVSL